MKEGWKTCAGLDEEVQALRRFAVDTERRFSHFKDMTISIYQDLGAEYYKLKEQVAKLRASMAENVNYFSDKSLDIITLLASLSDQKNDILRRVMELEKDRDLLKDLSGAVARGHSYSLIQQAAEQSNLLDKSSPAYKFKRGAPGKPKAAPKRRK